MNTTRVQLPNGNLLCIEGGDAQQVASIITNHLTRNVPTESPKVLPTLPFATRERLEAETPMEMPVMNFGVREQPVIETGGESPLVMPVMNFKR